MGSESSHGEEDLEVGGEVWSLNYSFSASRQVTVVAWTHKKLLQDMATEQAITFPTTYTISCLGSSAHLRARRKSGEICSGAGRVEMLCMVRPLKMAVLLLSVHALPHQCVLHLHPTHRTDIPTHLPQDPAGDYAYQRGDERHASLLFTLSPPYVNSPCNWQSPLPPRSEDCHHVLLTVGLTQWSYSGSCFRCVSCPFH